MKIIDISRELFSTPPYPGDPVPRRDRIRRIDMGDDCNLSGFYTCCHSATHLDAPSHYIDAGETIEQMNLDRCIGPCSVVDVLGIVTGADIDLLMPIVEKRVLFRGEGTSYLSQSAAFALADAGILLVGTDAQSIAPPQDEEGPHVELLSAGIPILEGLNLTGIRAGRYRLIALPLLLGGAEASPVRAVLIEE